MVSWAFSKRGALSERLAHVPGVRELPSFVAFDPADDRHVDEVAACLVERFRTQQDVEAFTLLFELTHERLLEGAGRLSRQLCPGIEAEDLVAGFMARMFCDLPSRDADGDADGPVDDGGHARPSGRAPRAPVRRFLGLAYTSMRNDVLDQLRQRKRALVKNRTYQDMLAEPVDPSRLIEEQEEQQVLDRCGLELLHITSDCFHELGARDQQVLLAREMLHLSYERVASMLQLDEQQVGMIIRRARQHLVNRIRKRLASTGSADTHAALTEGEVEVLQTTIAASLETRGQTKSVRVLLERMLERSARDARRRLADLVYEMVKACLVRAPSFAKRTLIHHQPRPRDEVAADIHRLSRRLERVPTADEARVPRELGATVDAVSETPVDHALDDADRCLTLLERIEGASGRQLVATALCCIHAGHPGQGEQILRSLETRELPPITRQNVARNLTLALMRQDRYADALREADRAAAAWPDDPVRVMNVCFATSRLGRRARFEGAVRELGAIHARSGDATVERWIQGPLGELAAALGISSRTLATLIDEAQVDGARQPPASDPARGQPVSADGHTPDGRSGAAHTPHSTEQLSPSEMPPRNGRSHDATRPVEQVAPQLATSRASTPDAVPTPRGRRSRNGRSRPGETRRAPSTAPHPEGGPA